MENISNETYLKCVQSKDIEEMCNQSKQTCRAFKCYDNFEGLAFGKQTVNFRNPLHLRFLY